MSQDPLICIFCKSDSDAVILGDMLTKGDISVHENCLYSSSGLVQDYEPNSEAKDHILGFKISSIKKEVSRSSRLKCSVCSKKNASIGCCVKTCVKSFHLPCIKVSCGITIFKNPFNSYCFMHMTAQKLNRFLESSSEMPECCICLSDIFEFLSSNITNKELLQSKLPNWYCQAINHFIDPKTNFQKALTKAQNQIIHGECCLKSWMHRDCCERYAASAALHHLKCPMCSCKNKFINNLRKYGIWIPDRDASWELDNNSYENSSVNSNEQVNSTHLTIDTNNRDMSLNISLVDSNNEVTICPADQSSHIQITHEDILINNLTKDPAEVESTLVPTTSEHCSNLEPPNQELNEPPRRLRSYFKMRGRLSEPFQNCYPAERRRKSRITSQNGAKRNSLNENPVKEKSSINPCSKIAPIPESVCKTDESLDKIIVDDSYEFMDNSELFRRNSTKRSSRKTLKKNHRPLCMNTAVSKSLITNPSLLMDTTDIESISSDRSQTRFEINTRNDCFEVIDLDDEYEISNATVINANRIANFINS